MYKLNIKITIIIVSLLIFLLINVNAQLCGTSDNSCPSGDLSNFDYANGDYSTIPQSDWDKIELSKAISNGRGKDFSVQQYTFFITNGKIDSIKDIVKDLDKSKFESAWSKISGVELNLGRGASWQNGLLVATYGNKGSVVLSDVPSSFSVTIDESGNVIIGADKDSSAYIHVPAKGTYFVENFVEKMLVYLPNKQEIKILGAIYMVDGQPLIFEGGRTFINDIIISSIAENTNICMARPCSGNYVHLGKTEIEADCLGCSLNFIGNNYFPVNRRLIDYQDDLMKINIGNMENKRGKLIATFKENQLPEIRNEGWIRIENDDNKITVDGKKVIKELFKESYTYKIKKLIKETFPDKDFSILGDLKSKKGSVHSVLITDDKTYIFDESQNVWSAKKGFIDKTIKKRNDLVRDYGIKIYGYYSLTELDLFSQGFKSIEDKFQIDVKKLGIKSTKGKNSPSKSIEIIERDDRFRGTKLASVSVGFVNHIFWSPDPKHGLKIPSRVSLNQFNSDRDDQYKSVLPHEVGHIVLNIANGKSMEERRENLPLFVNSKLMSDYVREITSAGISFSIEEVEGDTTSSIQSNYVIDRYNLKGDDKYFPNKFNTKVAYSRRSVDEHFAEVFDCIIQDCSWSKTKEAKPFVKLITEELKKYKR